MDLPDFYDEQVDKVYKFFYIKSLNRHTAEDLTSQTFILFIEQSKTQNIKDNKKYLYGIMRNIWLQFLRSKYQEALVEIEPVEDFESYTDENLSSFDLSDEPEHRLLPFVEKLPKKQRQVVEMRIFADMTVGETAIELGKDKNYVKTTFQRGMNSSTRDAK